MHIDWQEARALWADGFDMKDIAEAFGLHESVIYNNFTRLYGEAMERVA